MQKTNQSQSSDEGEDTEGKGKRIRQNKQYEGFNIYKEKDGWEVIKIVAQSNGRCKIECISIPDLRVFAIERFYKLMYHEMWRDQ